MERMQRQLMKKLHHLLNRCKESGKSEEVLWALLEVVGEEDDAQAEEYLYVGTVLDRIKAWLEHCD